MVTRPILLVICVATLLHALVARANTPPPRVVFLWFANGNSAPRDGLCHGRTPPPYTCSFAPTFASCRDEIAQRVRALYRAFDVEVVLEDPAPRPHFTVVVTSTPDGAWCGTDEARVRGTAPVNCRAQGEFGMTAYVFACGADPATCAVRIAQEQAHLVGLDHTSDPADAMFPFESPGARFVDGESRTMTPRCGRPKQNSYRSMLRLFGKRHRR